MEHRAAMPLRYPRRQPWTAVPHFTLELPPTDKAQDPKTQWTPLHDDAKRRGYTVVREYVDRLSGADSSRPQQNPCAMCAKVLGHRAFNATMTAKFSDKDPAGGRRCVDALMLTDKTNVRVLEFFERDKQVTGGSRQITQLAHDDAAWSHGREDSEEASPESVQISTSGFAIETASARAYDSFCRKL